MKKGMRVRLVLMAVATTLASGAHAQRFGPQLSWSDDFDFGIGARVQVPFEGLFTNEGPFFRNVRHGEFRLFLSGLRSQLRRGLADCVFHWAGWRASSRPVSRSAAENSFILTGGVLVGGPR